jgi:hypothetical protein
MLLIGGACDCGGESTAASTEALSDKNKKSYKKKQERPPSNIKKERGKNLSPRNRKACHSTSTARMQSIAVIGTQSTMTDLHSDQQKDVA